MLCKNIALISSKSSLLLDYVCLCIIRLSNNKGRIYLFDAWKSELLILLKTILWRMK